jgi:hypothetical protein
MKNPVSILLAVFLYLGVPVATSGATPPASANFRVISDLNGYAQPIGVAERSLGYCTRFPRCQPSFPSRFKASSPG